jgi:prepilin-type N-terminal cleavage/methylation domain-containing protein
MTQVSLRGFSLIEVLVVLGIIASIAFVALPRLGGNKKENIQNTVRKLSALTRQVQNQSSLQQKTYRLHFQVQEGQAQVLVESSPHPIPPSYWSAVGEEQANYRLPPASDQDEGPTLFTPDPVLGKNPLLLPPSWEWQSLMTSSRRRGDEGKQAFIHCYPNKQCEAALLRMRSRASGAEVSMVLNPVTARWSLHNKAVNADEVFEP